LRSATVGIDAVHRGQDRRFGAGNVAAFGESGEIMIRGYNVMQGYYKMPSRPQAIDATDGAVFLARWTTAAACDRRPHQGHVHTRGRNVYPAEVEGYLIRHRRSARPRSSACPMLISVRKAPRLCACRMRRWPRTSFATGAAQMSRHKLPKYFRFVVIR
jgi:fatty-acyl-CoA synthase